MECKLFLLLALASFAQGDYVSKLVVTFGLPSSKIAAFNGILANADNATNVHNQGWASLFSLLLKSEDITDADVAAGIAALSTSSRLPYESAALALGACEYLEPARNASTNFLRVAVVALRDAFKAAKPGTFSASKATIEGYRAVVDKGYVDSVNSFYDGIKKCLNSNDEEVLAVLEKARAGSNLGNVHITNGVFNGMILRTATPTICGNASYAIAIKELEAKSKAGAKADRENRYTFLRTAYLNSQLGGNGIFTELFAIQWALTVAYRGYREGNVVLFDTVNRHLDAVKLGFKDDGDIDFSRDDADLQAVIAAFDDGDYALSDSFLALHPESSVAILEGRETIHGLNIEGDEAFFNAVAAASALGANYTEVLEQIEVSRRAAVDPAPEYTSLFFNLIRNNITFPSVIESQLVSLQNITTIGAQGAVNSFLDAADLLAAATNKGKAPSSVYSQVEQLKFKAFAAVDHFSQGLTAASTLVLLYKNDC